MKWINVLLVAVVGAFLCGPAFAADSKTDKTTKKTDESKKKQTWAVVQVNDDLKVMTDDKATQLKKDIDKENKDNAKPKKGKKPEPKKTFKLLKGGFATEKEAEKYRDDQESKNKKDKSKTTKTDKTDKSTDKSTDKK